MTHFRISLCWWVGLPFVVVGGDGTPKLSPAEQKLVATAKSLNAEAIEFYRKGRLDDAVVRMQQALEVRRQLYPETSHPDGHIDLAVSLSNLGALAQLQGKLDKARGYLEGALAMQRKLFPASKYPAGHSSLASSLGNLGALHQTLGNLDIALDCHSQALAMNRKLYPTDTHPAGHSGIAMNLYNMGVLHMERDDHQRALTFLEESLAMRRRLYPESKFPAGYPEIAASLSSLAEFHRAQRSFERAMPYLEQVLSMQRKMYPESRFPNGHPDLMMAVSNVGVLMKSQGELAGAVTYLEQALAMQRKLYPPQKYPDGHPLIATGLHNLADALYLQGAYERSLPLAEQALAMRRALTPASSFPNGHPELAWSMTRLAGILKSLGQEKLALDYLQQALAMNRRLYPESKHPNGHYDIAISLYNVAMLLRDNKAYSDSAALFEKALAMRQRLYPAAKFPVGQREIAQTQHSLGVLLMLQQEYERAQALFDQAAVGFAAVYPTTHFPDGHIDSAELLGSQGFLWEAQGKPSQALPYLEKSLAAYHRLIRREIALASEAQALSFIASIPDIQGAYCSCVAKTTVAATDSYDALWSTKGAVMRMVAQRRSAATLRSASSPEIERDFKLLEETRRRIARLYAEPGKHSAARDRLLVELTDQRERLERDLARQVPALRAELEATAHGGRQLADALPSRTVFLDFFRYTHIEKGRIVGPRYLAYVLATDKPIQRVELGPAEPIDRAVKSWREDIESRRESGAAQLLTQLVWKPIEAHVPTETTTLYIAPDGNLARLPWAAVPREGGRVLLEDFAVAVVPQAPFLLEQLKTPRPTSGLTHALAVGGLHYHSKKWPDLPGAAAELQALGSAMPVTLTGANGTVGRLLTELPRVQLAHLATHGFFDAEALTTEHQRAEKARQARRFGDELRTIASKNPLGFTGLVLSHGEIVTGLSLAELPLEKLRLVTLSACETGLGEYTGGKGVENLQQAFHLAGCPNVIASLWKVNDAATAALMAKFYHELRVNKKLPIEALREAQLTIYRHPELIPDLAGERGAPRLKEAVAIKVGGAASGRRGTADTKLWAAFVLSGVGK